MDDLPGFWPFFLASPRAFRMCFGRRNHNTWIKKIQIYSFIYSTGPIIWYKVYAETLDILNIYTKNNKKRNAKVTAAAEGWEGVGRGGRRRACTPGWAGRRRRRRTGSQSTRLIVAGTGRSPCCSLGSGPAPGDRTSGPGIPASREKKREILCRTIPRKKYSISTSSWVWVVGHNDFNNLVALTRWWLHS